MFPPEPEKRRADDARVAAEFAAADVRIRAVFIDNQLVDLLI